MCLLIIAISYFVIKPTVSTGEHELSINSGAKSTDPSLTSVPSGKIGSRKSITLKDSVDVSASSNSTSPLQKNYQLTTEEKMEAEAWFAAKGQIGKVNSEYLTYSIETLEKLVKDGDINAIVPLGFAYLRRSGPEVALQFYLDMAARGYTHVYSQIGNLETSYKFEKAASAEEMSLSAIEVLANYNVAKLRGDRWPNITDGQFFIQRYKVQLSAEDQQQIDVRSREIYDQVQQKRTELGLGNFDNNVPESVKKYFDRMEYYLNESTKK